MSTIMLEYEDKFIWHAQITLLDLEKTMDTIHVAHEKQIEIERKGALKGGMNVEHHKESSSTLKLGETYDETYDNIDNNQENDTDGEDDNVEQIIEA